jgi:hypothetical protein
MKIHERGCLGVIASSCGQRRIVVAEASVMPRR